VTRFRSTLANCSGGSSTIGRTYRTINGTTGDMIIG
jgi:hypothetical protein